MVTFLTSSPTLEYNESCHEPALDPRNQFTDRLRAVWPDRARCLMVAAFPASHRQNDVMAAFYRDAVEASGLSVACFDLWDDRQDAGEMATRVKNYDVIFTAGGHVPTENKWFAQIGLAQALKGFDGVVVGTSAGSMNAAEVVYVWPEEPGESKIPVSELFVPGLGLAKCQLLPHYQKIKDSVLDGRKLMDDITCAHSFGHRFLAIPDGSYVLVKNGREVVCGEAYLVAEGEITLFCARNETRVFLSG